MNRVSTAHTHAAPRLGLSDWLVAAAVVAVGTAARLGLLNWMATQRDDQVSGLLTKWDAEFYTEIARAGYFAANIANDGPVEEKTLAFFPGFPWLLKAAHAVTGMDYGALAIVLNVLLTVVMAAGVMALVARTGAGLGARAAAAVVVTCAPMSIVFSMPYTEALFGALFFWVLVALTDRRWLMAGALIFALSFVRLTSVAVIAALAVMIIVYGRRDWRAWAALVIAPLPLVGYVVWASSHLQAQGGYFGIQAQHWNSQFDFGAATATWLVDSLTTEHVGYMLTSLVIVGAPLMLGLAWGRIPLPAWLASGALMANVLLSDGIMHSRPRLLLPAAIVMAAPVIAGWKYVPTWVTWLGVTAWAVFGTWFSAYMLAVFEWAI